jgi:hypothetical protein
LRLTPWLDLKVRYDAFERPQFGYGIYQAAIQAKALGYKAFSVIEFGVAGGNGLVAMEAVSAEVARYFGLRIEVYGFDTGQGQPPPEDYRDAPFIWKNGQFKMDKAKLSSRLSSAQLIIGDVGSSVTAFLERGPTAPVGFISFDMDYYSSTKRAFSLLNAKHEHFLPRAFCYFDDIVGDDYELHCDEIGELLAIKEFNAEHKSMKLAPIHGLRYKRTIPDHWHVKMYVLHRFGHPAYCKFINPNGDWQLPLKDMRLRAQTG